MLTHCDWHYLMYAWTIWSSPDLAGCGAVVVEGKSRHRDTFSSWKVGPDDLSRSLPIWAVLWFWSHLGFDHRRSGHFVRWKHHFCHCTYWHLGKNRYLGIQDPTQAAVQSVNPQINLIHHFICWMPGQVWSGYCNGLEEPNKGCLSVGLALCTQPFQDKIFPEDMKQSCGLHRGGTSFQQRTCSTELCLHPPHSAECSHIWFQSVLRSVLDW